MLSGKCVLKSNLIYMYEVDLALNGWYAIKADLTQPK